MSKSFIRSSSIVSAMTFVSRILGLIRDFVIARLFGANELTDAFLVAFRIPNFF
ncbi:MAG: murein biosynthesis integral membrane protein MurJ, partial [Gammaproteobacteria bacterium]|nr:murein biosynthesis integral membrane protein MurJ [Gammaproteobacteria bacterium]